MNPHIQHTERYKLWSQEKYFKHQQETSSTSTDSKCTDRKPGCYNVRCPSDFKADTLSCVTTVSILTRISILLSLLNSMSVSSHYTDLLDCCISIEVISHTRTHKYNLSFCFLLTRCVLHTCTHTFSGRLLRPSVGPLACMCVSNRISSPVRSTPAVPAYNALHTVSARWRITELDQ